MCNFSSRLAVLMAVLSFLAGLLPLEARLLTLLP